LSLALTPGRIAIFVLSLFASLSFILYSRASNLITPPTKASQPVQQDCCGQDDSKPHLLVGTYYSLKENLTAKLLLNNKGPNVLVPNRL
jgi:hypothetical protein